MLSDALEEALKRNRLGHCLLFVGAESSGQKEAAWALAEKVFEGDSRLIMQGSHPDFMMIGPEEDDTMIKLSAVKELIARAGLAPLKAPAKFFVIDQAHLMNETAQSALLKTLEEPPGRTHFILITSTPNGLLETIRSRAQKFYFSPKVEAKVLDEDLLKQYRAAFKFMMGGNALWPDFSKEERVDVMCVLDALASTLRDSLMIRIGAGQLLASEEDLLDKKEFARRFSEQEIAQRIEFLADAKEKVKSSLNVKIVMNHLWDQIGAINAR